MKKFEIADLMRKSMKVISSKKGKVAFLDKFLNGNKNQNKLLFIRKKKNKEKNEDIIQKRIFDYFNKPEKYFDLNYPVVVNKKIDIKDKDYLRVSNSCKMNNSKRIKSGKGSSDLSSRGSSSAKNDYIKRATLRRSSFIISKKKYEIIYNGKLKEIFENFKNPKLKKIFKENLENEEEKNSFIKKIKKIDNKEKIPVEMQNSLNKQNRIIKYQDKEIKAREEMGKYISKKINKKEDDLLFNKTEEYRYKRLLIDSIEERRDIPKKFGNDYWNTSLRQPDKLKYLDIVPYKKLNKSNSLCCNNFIRPSRHKEISLIPSSSSSTTNNFNNTKIVENCRKLFLNKIKMINNLSSINIKGQNLYDYEYKNEMKIKCRKKLHKFIVDQGKDIFDEDINKTYYDKIFFKNYSFYNNFVHKNGVSFINKFLPSS